MQNHSERQCCTADNSVEAEGGAVYLRQGNALTKQDDSVNVVITMLTLMVELLVCMRTVASQLWEMLHSEQTRHLEEEEFTWEKKTPLSSKMVSNLQTMLRL